MKKAILFDLDGTILYTDKLIELSFRKVFEKYKPGYTLSEAEILSFLGPSLKETFSKYFPEDMFLELNACYQEFNLTHHEQYVYVYDTVKETLQYLKDKGYPMGIITTKGHKPLMVGLETFDLKQYFDVTVAGDEVENQKPDPEGINKALSKLGLEDGYYIGDNVNDGKAGRNAGLTTIGVKWSPKGYQELSKYCDYLVDEMKEIIKIIEE